jgi:methyltransferase (TIGR00027 family)
MNRVIDLEGVSDTAFITAMARALETQRPDAHFRDPFAARLAGEKGKELIERGTTRDATAAGCIVRTCVLDELLRGMLERDEVRTVVNLGAGLDARPYRLPLPASLRWVDVDQASVLDYKANVLADCQPVCGYESMAADLTDARALETLLRTLCADARRVLVLSEGLLIYLTSEQVSRLALTLAAQPELRWWLCDLLSPTALMMMGGVLANVVSRPTAKFEFAPENAAVFFERHGWKSLETRSCLAEGLRLNRWQPSASILFAMMLDRDPKSWANFYTVVKLIRDVP